MALTIKILGHGTIGSTQSGNDLLTEYASNAVPDGKAVILKYIRMVNKHTAAKTVTIQYLHGGTNPVAAFPVNLNLPVNALILLDEELMLVADDKLQASFGETATADVVDFVVGGVERDQ